MDRRTWRTGGNRLLLRVFAVLGAILVVVAAIEGEWFFAGLGAFYLAAPAVALLSDRPRSVTVDDAGLTISRGLRGSDTIAWGDVRDISSDEQRLHIEVHTVDGRRIATGLDPGPDRELLVLWRRRNRD